MHIHAQYLALINLNLKFVLKPVSHSFLFSLTVWRTDHDNNLDICDKKICLCTVAQSYAPTVSSPWHLDLSLQRGNSLRALSPKLGFNLNFNKIHFWHKSIMDNFNLDPVTVCCQKRPSHFEMAIARSLGPNAGRSNFLPNSLSYQQFQRKLKNG